MWLVIRALLGTAAHFCICSLIPNTKLETLHQPGDTIMRLAGRDVQTISLRGLETLCAGKVTPKVDASVPRTQGVNLSIVRQPD